MWGKKVGFSCVCAFVILGQFPLAVAQTKQAAGASADDVYSRQFQVENDLFVGGHTDRWYTNGLRYSWTYKGAPTNGFLRDLHAIPRKFGLLGETGSHAYSIGQSMYSPRDIGSALPQAQDRPWSGFLYLSMGADGYKDSEYQSNEVKIGVTGYASLADAAQIEWHRIIGSRYPAGWPLQTHIRPVVQFTHAKVNRQQDLIKDLLGWQTSYGFGLGNARVYGNASASVLLGKLKKDDAPLLIANEGDFTVHDVNRREMYKSLFGFASIGAQAVGYNYFIEGPTPYVSDIRTMPTVGTAQLGFSVPIWKSTNPGVRLVFTVNARTSEFQTISTGASGGVQRWGSFTFVVAPM